MRSQRDGSPGAASRTRRRVQGALFGAGLTVLVVGTAVGVLVARDRSRDLAERRAQESATAAADALESLILDTATALRGAGVVVDSDGSVDPVSFAAFARDLQAGGLRLDLALAVQRSDLLDEVEWVAVAPVRRGATPDPPPVLDDSLAQAWGASATTAGPAVSDLTDLVVADGRGVVVVRPVVDRSRTQPVTVARITADLPERLLLDTLEEAAGRFEVSLVRDGAAVLGAEVDAASRRAGVTSAVDVPGAVQWSVIVLRAPRPSLLLPGLVGAGGVVATVAMLTLLYVTSRHQRAMVLANRRLALGQERARAVQEVAGRLAQALTRDEVVRALVDHLPTAVGARSTALAMVEQTGEVEVFRTGGSPASPVSAADGSKIAEVIGSLQPAWMESPLAWRDDESVALLVGSGRAAAMLPLTSPGHRGVVVVAYDNVHLFSEDERALLQTVGLLASRALARGHRYDQEHRVAVAFQAAALPDALPALDGVTVAARYRPATRAAAVGGDWYDVIALDDGRVLMVVGDVVGHGLTAAATMGRLRTAFRVIAPIAGDPGAMLRAMAAQVDSIPDSFCTTVVCAIVDVAAGTVTWSRAGHPPPVLVSAATGSLLDARGAPPLGVVPEPETPIHTQRVGPGDLIVLYTDGLVERRGESIDVGLDRLRVVAAELADLDPPEMVDALVEALVPSDEQTDDVAVLVARLDVAPCA